jgi:hypothetical protein
LGKAVTQLTDLKTRDSGDRTTIKARKPVINTTETAIVDKPADEDEHAGHHHGHAH